MLFVCSQLSLYMALAPEEKIKYTEGGPQALANFEAGAAGFEARAFRGCGVVTSDPFEVADGAHAARNSSSKNESLATTADSCDSFVSF